MHDSLLKAVHGQSPLDQLVDAEDRDRLRSALDSLSEKDRRVLSMRFGIDGKRVHSVAQVANACRLSPQHAEMLITAAKTRLLAAIVSGTASSGSATTSEKPSATTSTTPIESPSPKSSRTEASAKKNGKNAAGSPKTG